MPEHCLFNAMDNSLLGLTLQTFEESLVLNVLFQKSIIVNEPLFFNCVYLAQHARKHPGRVPLFDLACRRGIIRPAFRNRSICTLKEASKTKIYGADYQLISQDLKPFIDRVITSADMGVKASGKEPFFWPENISLGEKYESFVREIFQQDNPPLNFVEDSDRKSLFDRMWPATARWRTEFVNEASKRTVAKGAAGMQRVELYNLLGWSFGVPQSNVSVSAGQILSNAPDPEAKLAAELFIKWLAQCKHVVEARAFNASINFPAYDLDRDFLLDSILRSPKDSLGETQKSFRVTVKMPSLEGLLNVDGTELIAIRDELGADYLEQLEDWQNFPSMYHREKVVSSLKLYCDELSERYSRTLSTDLSVDIFSGRVRQVASAMKGTYTKLSPFFGPQIATLNNVARVGCAIYGVLRTEHQSRRRAPKERNIEINLSNTANIDIDI